MSHTAEFHTRGKVIDRCTNTKNKRWKDYGGRGISVCQRWLDSFENFFADVGPRPSPQHSLDRYPDNDGDYEPGNVRWATRQQQNGNTRKNIYVRHQGKRMCIAEFARAVGIKYQIAHIYISKQGMTAKQVLERVKKWTRPRMITHDGETMSLADWARRLGVHHMSIHQHLKKGRTMEWIVSRFT
jgi:hypothetical protein